jgi:protein-disulfide isomerase
MKRLLKNQGAFFGAMLMAAVVVLSAAPQARAAAEQDRLKDMVREVLRDNPGLVMDVLRQNPEQVLDIVRDGNRIARDRAMRAQWQADMTQPKQVKLDGRPVRGPQDAPVTIVAYSDFTCPYCAQAAGTVAALMEHYKGKVRLVFKHYPLKSHDNAETASRMFVAAAMQDEAKAWALYDAMFVERARVIKEGSAFISAKAAELGLDAARLARDAQSDSATRILREDRQEAENLGLEGTPTFLVNDIVVRGSLPLPQFADAVDMAWAKAAGR